MLMVPLRRNSHAIEKSPRVSKVKSPCTPQFAVTKTDMEQGGPEHFTNLFEGDMEKVTNFTNSLQELEHAGMEAV